MEILEELMTEQILTKLIKLLMLSDNGHVIRLVQIGEVNLRVILQMRFSILRTSIIHLTRKIQKRSSQKTLKITNSNKQINLQQPNFS